MQNKDHNTSYHGGSRGKQPLGLIILVVILFLIAAALAFKYFRLTQQQEEQYIELEYVKDSLVLELTDLMDEFDSLKTDNDSMNVLVEVQQDYIRDLLRMKANNRERIRTYEKELKTLREIMRSYIVQIDSLNTRNQILTAENFEIKSKLKQTENEREKLKEEKAVLDSKVELASVLSAKDITAMPLNKNSKERDRAKTIEKIKTCFTVRENPIVPAGPKEIYLRIYRPDGFLMTPSADNVFESEEGTLIFSAKRQLQYENVDIEMCIFYDKTEEFVEGTYNVELYADGNKIGETNFTLK